MMPLRKIAILHRTVALFYVPQSPEALLILSLILVTCPGTPQKGPKRPPRGPEEAPKRP